VSSLDPNILNFILYLLGVIATIAVVLYHILSSEIEEEEEEK